MATLSTALLATLIALGTALSSWKKMALIILVEANAWLLLLLGNLSPGQALAFFLLSFPRSFCTKVPPCPAAPVVRASENSAD